MRIFVDENIPAITVAELQAQGHHVTDIRHTPQQGMADEDIWGLVTDEKRLLITTDKGFAKYRDEGHSAS